MKIFLISSILLLLVFSLVACQSREISTSDISSSQTTGVNEGEWIENGNLETTPNEKKIIKSESIGSKATESKPKETESAANRIESAHSKNNTVSTIPHEEEPAKDVRIRLTFNNTEIIVKMNDNPTSLDFVKKLPLTLTFKDYAGTEKISYLPQKLSTEGSPSGYDPSVGELAYYAPWGNICFYYRDFGYSNGLVPLGSIESGMESLTNLDGDFTVTIEKVVA
ncbi:MAG: cyclophilin-like fold protein [Bacillota bacterium]